MPNFELRRLQLAVNTPGYAAADVIGGLTSFNIGKNAGAKVVSMSVVDYQVVVAAPSVEIHLFKESPSGTAIDNANTSITDTQNYLGVLQQGTASYRTAGASAIHSVSQTAAGLGLVLAGDKNGDVWALPLILTTSTFAVAAAGLGLDVILGLELQN